MTSTGLDLAAQPQDLATVAMKLEVITIAVSDVDRAKSFYEQLGWRIDADLSVGDAFRVLQFTPPGSDCSVSFGKGVTTAQPGSAQRIILAVSDIDPAREDLVDRGIEVSEVFHRGPSGIESGPDPDRQSYNTYASFSDPDGNAWVLQEVTDRLPGRLWED
jgi:catechol 2,3-dioxygenase-like lactoylglutathione lyase family enzyme